MHEEFWLRNSVAAARFVFDRETHIIPFSKSSPAAHRSTSSRQIIALTYNNFLREKIYKEKEKEKKKIDWIAKENKIKRKKNE